MIQDERTPAGDRQPLISDDLTTNANADTQDANSVRQPNHLRLTTYNIDEKFITAKFDNIENLRNSYDQIVDHGFPSEEIVLSILGETEDEFFKSVDDLKSDYEKHNHHGHVGMGLESSSDEMTAFVRDVWNKNNVVEINP